MSTAPELESWAPAAVCQARRRLAVVVVEGLCPAGLQIAQHLIRSRIGTLVLRDDQPVTREDTGLRSMDAGRRRAEAAAGLLGGASGETAVIEAPPESSIRGADLHLLVGQRRASDAMLSRRLEESPVLLPVSVTTAGWRIGPLLHQASLVCSHCMGISPFNQQQPPAADADITVLQAAAAAVAAQQVVILINGLTPGVLRGAGLMAEAATGRIKTIQHHPRRECVCG